MFLGFKSVTAAPVLSPSPQTQTEIRGLTQRLFSALTARDEAKMRALWLPKSGDADTLAEWMNDSKKQEKFRIYSFKSVSGWQKWVDKGVTRVRFRVQKDVNIQPKTGKKWTSEKDWIMVCQRAKGVWKFEEFWPREPDFYKQFGALTTPLERENFLNVEWGHQPPLLTPLAMGEERMARDLTARLLSSYEKRDARAFAALWDAKSPDFAAFKESFAGDMQQNSRITFRDVTLRWGRKRTHLGQTRIKWTARFTMVFQGKSEKKPQESRAEWRLTMAMPGAASPQPRLVNRVTFYNSYTGVIEQASATRRGILWEDDWEIARATFARPPVEALKTLARARIRTLLDDFCEQDVGALRAAWTGAKTEGFIAFAQEDFKEGDQTRFENLRFEHWKSFQDDEGEALQVRVRLDWSWRDLPLKTASVTTSETASEAVPNAPQNARSRTQQLWIFTLRPDSGDRKSWKFSAKWSRSPNLRTALKGQKTPSSWAEILNEQREFERESPASRSQIAAAQIPVEAFLGALRNGDGAAVREVWKASTYTNYGNGFQDILTGRGNNRISVESQNWTRIEERDSLAPPRLRVSLALRWDWQGKDGKADFKREIWDLWLEPDVAQPGGSRLDGAQPGGSGEKSWHLTEWRQRERDLKRDLSETGAWYCAWILDDERAALSDAGLRALSAWIYEEMPEKPASARAAVMSLRTGTLLAKNPVQYAFAQLTGAQIENEYFYEEQTDAGSQQRLNDLADTGIAMVRVGHLPGAAGLFRYLGGAAAENRDAATAKSIHELALDFSRQTGDVGIQIDLLGDLSNDCEKLGLLDESAAHYQSAIRLAKAENDLPRQLLARANAACLRFNRGELGPALRDLIACREEANAAKLSIGEGDFSRVIGQLLAATGQTDEAVATYEKALEAARKRAEPLAQMELITLLSEAYSNRFLRRGALPGDPDLDRALEMMQRGAAMEKSVKASRALHYRAAELNLTQIALMLGWTRAVRSDGNAKRDDILINAAAAALENQAEKMEKLRALGFQIDTQLWGSELLRQQEKWPEALAAQEKAAQFASRGFNDEKIKVAAQRGDILRDMKRLEEATKSYREALSLLEARRAGAQDKLLQSGVTQSGIEIYQKLADCLVRQKAPDDEILAAVEGARARSLTEMVGQGANQAQNGLSVAQKNQEKRLARSVTQLQLHLDSLSGGQNQAQIALLQTLRSSDAASEDTAPLRQKLTGARRDLEAFRREIFLQNPDLQAKRGQWTPPTLQQIGAKLFKNRPGRRIVSFVVGDEATMLLVFSPPLQTGSAAKLDTFSIPVSRSELIKKVGIIRRARSRASSISDDFSFTHNQLFGPITKQLEGATELVIIPDGPLGGLPFASLNDEEGTFMLEKYDISYAPGLAALMAMEKPPSGTRKDNRTPFVAMSRSQFGEIGLKNLPGTRAEVEAIAPLFGNGARVAIDANATKDFARRELPNARLIHLATHGLLNEAAPLYSAVALSPDKNDVDGRLYARDLMQMNLNADLVVLSACETALGQEVRGEGVLGLTWALFVAGVPTTVVTQWSVDDAATSALMQKFYSELRSGKTPAAALRNAQLSLLKSKTMRHPAYWAPFIAVGAAN